MYPTLPTSDSKSQVEIGSAKPIPSSEKNNTIEILRCIACFFVIWLHVPSTSNAVEYVNLAIKPIAVPFFYLSSLTFFLGSIRKSSQEDIFKKALYRIAIPYLAWTAIYAMMLSMNEIVLGKPNHLIWWQTLFYGQSGVQLYFLPQLLMLQTILFAMEISNTNSLRNRLLGLSLFLLVTIYLVIGYTFEIFGMTPPLAIAGYVLSTYLLRSISKKQSGYGSYLWLLVLLFGCALWVLSPNPDDFKYLKTLPFAGLALMSLTFYWKMPKLSNISKTIAANTFGIYLSHVLVLEVSEVVIKVLGVSFNDSFITKTVFTVVIFIISLFLVTVIRRFKIPRGLFLGETPVIQNSYSLLTPRVSHLFYIIKKGLKTKDK